MYATLYQMQLLEPRRSENGAPAISMIKSMTGFASAAAESEHATITVTIRAVNHRHLDLQLRVPQALAEAEGRIRASVQRRIGRGRIELAVNVQYRHTASVEVEFNESLAVALAAALESARSRGIIQGALTPGDLLRLPQALAVRERPVERDEAWWRSCCRWLDEAVDEAVDAAGHDARHRRRSPERRPGSPPRAARRHAGADCRCGRSRAGWSCRRGWRRACRSWRRTCRRTRTLIAQEIVQSRVALGHQRRDGTVPRAPCALASRWPDPTSPCGRKLDFLLQEMNREVNTIGSKADGLRVSNLVIAAKAELEKMREQVQNVE